MTPAPTTKATRTRHSRPRFERESLADARSALSCNSLSWASVGMPNIIRKSLAGFWALDSGISGRYCHLGPGAETPGKLEIRISKLEESSKDKGSKTNESRPRGYASLEGRTSEAGGRLATATWRPQRSGMGSQCLRFLSDKPAICSCSRCFSARMRIARSHFSYAAGSVRAAIGMATDYLEPCRAAEAGPCGWSR